jgi:hypothetical protein
MRLLRGSIFAITTLSMAVAQETACVPMAQPPPTPAVTLNALRGEGCVPGTAMTIMRTLKVFNDWKPDRKPAGTLHIGEHVVLVNAVSIVEHPDVLVAHAPVPSLHVSPGDTMLRYTHFGEGESQLWVRGCWYAQADASFVRNAGGTGCRNQCSAQETEPGKQLWWYQVRLRNGRVVWVQNFAFIRK